MGGAKGSVAKTMRGAAPGKQRESVLISAARIQEFVQKTTRLARLSRVAALLGSVCALLLLSGQGLDNPRSSQVAVSVERNSEAEEAVENRTGNSGDRTDGALPLRAVRQIEALLAEKAQRTPSQRKVSSRLLDAGRETSERATAEPRRDSEETDAPKGLVTVDIRADVTPGVLARIRSLGGIVVNSVPKYRAIRARLPQDALELLAMLEAVRFIRPAEEPVTRQALRHSALDLAVVATSKVDTTEGDVAHQANVARQTHSVDGTGIGVGVISDGVDMFADQQATGDVPAQVTVLPGQEGRRV